MLKIGRGASAPPFIVMDVIAAANARQAALPPGAPGVIRMEVGQPGTGAPAGALAPRPIFSTCFSRPQKSSGAMTFCGRPAMKARIVSAPLERMSSQASGVWNAEWGVIIRRPSVQGSRAR